MNLLLFLMMFATKAKVEPPTPTFAYVIKAYCAKGFSPATVEPSDNRGTSGPDGKYYACISQDDNDGWAEKCEDVNPIDYDACMEDKQENEDNKQ